MFWTENNSQILLFEAGVLTIAIPASPDTHATSEIECLKKKKTSQEYIPWASEFFKQRKEKVVHQALIQCTFVLLGFNTNFSKVWVFFLCIKTTNLEEKDKKAAVLF